MSYLISNLFLSRVDENYLKVILYHYSSDDFICMILLSQEM